MGLTTTTRNSMLTGLSVTATYVSLHTGDPGSTGANEVAGGSYVRKPVAWSTPSSGAMTAATALTLQVPASTTITHFGVWDSASGGEFKGGAPLDTAQTYVVAGGYSFTPTITAAAGEVQEWAANTPYAAGQEVMRHGLRYLVAADHTSPATFAPSSNLTLLSAPFHGCPVPSGNYVCPVGLASTSTSAALGNGTLRVAMWYLPHAVTLTKITAEVATIGDVGSKVRLGIYKDAGDFTPGALVVDAGQILGDSATHQELTISATLAAGIYWIGGAVQSAAGTQPTLRTVALANAPVGVTALPSANQSAAGLAKTGVTGALPDPFGTPTVSGSMPRIFVKAA
jgi:hypothetical protein